jgi:23S rRNA (adenine2030-N6)-methyltransferase
MLWYPILSTGDHELMLEEIEEIGFPETLRHEVSFAPAGTNHRLEGSGVFVINAPYTLAEDAQAVTRVFGTFRQAAAPLIQLRKARWCTTATAA